MKHFVYTHRETSRRRGHIYWTTTVWVVKRNSLFLVGKLEDSYVDDWQQVRVILDNHSIRYLPRSVTQKKHSNGDWDFSRHSLVQDGIADFQRVIA